MISFGISGRFRLELIDSRTGFITQVREFDNLILDTGLNGYGSGLNNNVDRCWVGTGSNPPTPADLRLQSPLGWATHIYKYGGEPYTYGTAPDYVSSLTKEYRFSAGAIVGNVAEIGLSTPSEHADAVFWCRCLVKNAAGVPEPLPVGSNNSLRVYYTIYLHPELGDLSYSFDFDGVTYNCTSRPSMIQESRPGGGESSINVSSGIEVREVYNGGQLGPITGTITGYNSKEFLNDYDTGIPTAQPYVQNSFYRDYSQPFPLDYANLNGGIDGFKIEWRGAGNYWASGGQFLVYTQVKLDKPIPKDNTCSFRLMLRTSWHRWEDPNA